MNKKSRIKSTLDSLFTGGKISPDEEKDSRQSTPKETEPASEIPGQNIPAKKSLEPTSPPSGPVKVEPDIKVTPPAGNGEPPKEELRKEVKTETGAGAQEKSEAKPIETKPTRSVTENKKTDADRVQQLADAIDQAQISLDDDDEHLVIFTLGKELYGVTIHDVESIIKLQAITQVPRTAGFILGVTNLRGTVVPVLDLRRRFNLESCEDTSSTRIVIINTEGAKVGIVVDEVTEVLKVSRKSIQPPPPMSTTIESAFINGIARINERLVILLDLEKVLASSSHHHNR